MATRESLTRRALHGRKKRTDRNSPIKSLLSDSEFVSSCANVASFVGDALCATDNPVSSKLFHGVADAARDNLMPTVVVEPPTRAELEQQLQILVSEWATIDKSTEPEAYAAKETQIEVIQKVLGPSTGVANDS